jgi:hypothetical protein
MLRTTFRSRGIDCPWSSSGSLRNLTAARDPSDSQVAPA